MLTAMAAAESHTMEPQYHLLLGQQVRIRVPKMISPVNEPITVEFSHMAGFTDDWIGIYPAESSNDWGNQVGWAFTSGLKSGILSIDIGAVAPGSYEARVFFHNSFQQEATSSFLIFAESSVTKPTYRDAARPRLPELDGEMYGAMGEHQVRKISISNPWPAYEPDAALQVDLYFPADISGKRPTVFFISGWHQYSSENYLSLLYFITSQGYNCVFIPYRDTDPQGNPDILLTILDRVVDTFDPLIDTTKIGFAGHSMGGGLIFSLALKKANWGTKGRFLFSLAAWWGFHLPPTGDIVYPANTNLIVQTNANDPGTDPRQNIDFLTHNTIAAERKSYLYLPGDAQHHVDHGVSYSPFEDDAYIYDALEQVGLHRPLESLMRYTFENDTEWKHIGLPDPGDQNYNTFAETNGISVYLGDDPLAETENTIPIPPEANLTQDYLCSREANPRRTMCMPCGDNDRHGQWTECQY